MPSRLSKKEVRVGCFTLDRDVIFWKKAWVSRSKTEKSSNDIMVIVKLLVPRGAWLVVPQDEAVGMAICNMYEKLRVSTARVLSIRSIGWNKRYTRAHSDWNTAFEYRQGRVVKPEGFYSGYKIVCAGGIHCFRTRRQAVAYDL